MITCNSSNLSNMDKATPTNYQLIFPLIPEQTSISANNPFVMNIFSAVIPSLSIATEELRWQGNKTRHSMEPIEFDPWLVSFVVDSRLENWKLLFEWMAYINNNFDKIAEKHHRYGVDAALVVTDNYANAVLELRFIDIWPATLGEVSFSQREGDITLESTVNFNYDYFLIRETGWTNNPIFGYSSSSSSSSTSSSSSSSLSSSSSSLSSSSSSVSSSSSSTSPTWQSIFDNTNWEPDEPDNDFGHWDVSKWESDDRDNDQPGGDWTVFLRPIGSWATGFRPTKMRITYSIVNMRYYIRDTSDNIIANDLGYVSGDEITLDFSNGLDIGTIDLRDFIAGWEVTNIEFYF